MSILDRLVQLCKADLHGLMDALEDKQLLLKQSLREMEEELERTRARYGRVLAERRYVAAEADRTRSRIERVEADLDLTVAAQRDDLSRARIKQRRALLAHWDECGRRLAECDARAVSLRERIEYEELTVERVRLRAAEYGSVAQQEAAPDADGAEDYHVADLWRVSVNVGASQAPSDATLDLDVELELLRLKEAAQRAPAQAAA